MEEYKAQYYNEMLQHFGVKGMKWGVRRKRVTNALKNRTKASVRAAANTYTHPIMSVKTLKKMNKGASFKTKLRRKAIGYSTKELNAYNKDMKRAIASKKKRKGTVSTSKRRKKIIAAGKVAQALGNRTKASVRAAANTYTHPIMSVKTLKKMNKGASFKTKLRRKAIGYSTKELNAYNKDMKRAIASKKKKKRR